MTIRTSSFDIVNASNFTPLQVANGISVESCYSAAVNPGNSNPSGVGIRAIDTKREVPGCLAKELVCIHTHREGNDLPKSFSVYPRPFSIEIVVTTVVVVSISPLPCLSINVSDP